MFKKSISKFFNLLLGYPLYFISFFSLRNGKKIVLGSHTPFNDNSKYFYLLSKKYLGDSRVIWITPNKAIRDRLQGERQEVYLKYSLRGLYHSLTAKYYIYSFHLPDINFWTSGGACKINLWHGIPLKDIAFAVKSGPSTKTYNEKSFLSRLIRPHIFVRPDYMLTTSARMSHYFAKAFRIPVDQCLEFGLTRCDIFSWKKKEVFEFIKEYESENFHRLIQQIELYNRTFIYMPTWREKEDFLLGVKFDFERLNDVLREQNILLLFKFHPYTKFVKINTCTINEYSNLSFIDQEMDVYPLLPFTDALITDYSSIYYDYLLLKKPVYLFPFDYNEYVQDSRSLAFDYLEKMPGERLENFSDFLELLIREKYPFKNEQSKISLEYFGDFKGDAIQRLCQFINMKNKETK